MSKPTAAKVPTSNIVDWESFHRVCADVLGFPDFYGANMNAWIDCMTYITDPEDAMTGVTTDSNGRFHLIVEDAADFRQRLPEIFEALIDCTAAVNARMVELGQAAGVVLEVG